MRYTEKETNIIGLETGFYRIKKDNSNSCITDNCGNQRELNSLFLGQQKLGQLEDDEEDIEFDLHTILATLKSSHGILVKNTQGIRGYTYHSRSYLTFGYDEHDGWYFTYKSKGMPQYFIKDYKVTWAFNKEDLL